MGNQEGVILRSVNNDRRSPRNSFFSGRSCFIILLFTIQRVSGVGILFGPASWFGLYHWLFTWLITLLICGAILLAAVFFFMTGAKAIIGLPATRAHSYEIGKQHAEEEIVELNTSLQNV